MAESFYELSKRKVLDNIQLAEWIRQLEDRIGRLESRSPRVTGSKPERPG